MLSLEFFELLKYDFLTEHVIQQKNSPKSLVHVTDLRGPHRALDIVLSL